MGEEDEELEDEEAENDLENLEDEEPQIYEAPTTDTSWTSSDSGISEPTPVLTSINNNGSDPMLCTSTSLANQVAKSHLAASTGTIHHHHEDFMDFTDLEDLMDTLHGMPKIDFEDNFEMFP